MAREIKFRALYHDTEDNTMKFAYGLIGWMDDKVVQLFTKKDKANNSADVWNCIPGTEGQYTGLKDKNGEEIYEGDVVVTSGYQNPFSGETENCVSVVEYLGPHLIYRASADSHETVYDLIGSSDKDDDAEIIGNVHQNPELTKA